MNDDKRFRQTQGALLANALDNITDDELREIIRGRFDGAHNAFSMWPKLTVIWEEMTREKLSALGDVIGPFVQEAILTHEARNAA